MSYVSKSKDPAAILDYVWPWAAEGWLVDGDTIDSADFTVYAADGSDISDSDTTPVEVDSSSATGTDATAWISGGTLGLTYLVTCHIVTDGGREDDRSLKLKIISK